MGIFVAYPVGRVLLIGSASVGLTMLILGELYILDSWLSRSILRPGRVRKIISFVPLLFPPIGWFVVADNGGLWLFKSPGPAWSGFIEGAIYYLVGESFYVLFLASISFRSRFTTPSPLQRKSRPAIKKRWFGYGLLLSIGLGLVLGLLVGSLSANPSDSYPMNQASFTLPLLGWTFALYGLVLGCSIGLPFAIFGPFWQRLHWRITSLPQELFPKVGVALLLLGSIITGFIFWQVA